MGAFLVFDCVFFQAENGVGTLKYKLEKSFAFSA